MKYTLKATRYRLAYYDGQVGLFISRVEIQDEDGKFIRDAQLHKLSENAEGMKIEFGKLINDKELTADQRSYGIMFNYAPKQHIRALDMEIILEQAAKDFPNAVTPQDAEAVYWQRDKTENLIKVYAVQANGIEVFIAKFPDAR